MKQAKLMKPLFDGNNFNQAGRRMRVAFWGEVSNGTVCFRLWQSAGKPDISYPRAENDKYLLYAEINEYLVPLRETEYSLITHCGHALAIAELYGDEEQRDKYFDELRKQEQAYTIMEEVWAQESETIIRYGSDQSRQADFIQAYMSSCVETYRESKENGGETWPDFSGAAVLGELDACVELSKTYQARREAKRQKAHQAEIMKRQAHAREENEKTEAKIQSALEILRRGGTLENERIKVYALTEDGCKGSEYSIINHLMRLFEIKTPLRTQGWINDKLISVTILDGRYSGGSYYKRKGGTCSQAFFSYMNDLIAAVCAQQEN